jgi:transcriptional regulator with XRE-family HTH domain
MPEFLIVMTGPEIKAARERAKMTQPQLAAAVGVGKGTVSNWERGETVPKNRMAAIEELFRDQQRKDDQDPLRHVSDGELLAELTRRAAQRERYG